MTQQTICHGDITEACGIIAANREAYTINRPLPTTPARRRQRLLAEGRDALASALMNKFGLKNYSTLTAAIRRGFGPTPDWESINQAGAVALGIWEN